MVIGIIVVGSLCFMPLLGWMHHIVFVSKGRRSAWSYAHIWLGRIMLVLGGINGGLGFKIEHSIRGPWQTAYIVLAAFFFLLWFAVAAWDEVKRSNSKMKSAKRHASSESWGTGSTEAVDPGVGQKV